MAIRNAQLGGTDFSNGEVLYDYDLDDTNNIIINAVGAGHAENSYKMLQVADVFTNGPNTAADEFTDATGTNNTVNIGTSTAIFSGNSYIGLNDIAGSNTLYNPDTFTNPSNAFDKNLSTFAYWSSASTGTITKNLGETFASPTYITHLISKFGWYGSGGGTNSYNIDVYTYNGSTWSLFGNLSSGSLAGSSYAGTGFDSIIVNQTVSGIAIRASVTSTSSISNKFDCYELQYGLGASSSIVVCDSNTLTLDGTEKALIVSTPDSVWGTGNSYTVTASDGTTSTSAQTINSTSKNTGVFSISTLSSGTLKLTFTLATSNTSFTPELKGYGVYVIR